MTPLGLLKAELFEKLTIIPRTLLPIEIREMEQGILIVDEQLHEIIVFPLPLPPWVGEGKTASHIARAWAWERDGCIVFLVEIPEEKQGRLLVETIPYLNSRADVAGRFYQAADNRTYYLNSQTVFCRGDMDNGRPVNLLTVKAARAAAGHLVGYSLAGVVRDLSLAIYLISKIESDFEGLKHGGGKTC